MLNATNQIAALREMTPAQIREKYLEVFGEQSRTGNKDFLFKRIAWRIQSLAEGTLSERARRRATELARDADIRTTMPRPPKLATGAIERIKAGPVGNGQRVPIPGTVLTRQYRGKLIEVTVLPKGFEYRGEIYRSLSAVAKVVTGSHWNGHLFFGLKDGDKK
jgi:hypothetical protein